MSTRPLIVLAEDDDAMRALLEDTLERHGFEVIALEDGFELIDYLELLSQPGHHRRPAAVITDVHMPGRSGLDAVRFARDELLHVIVISAFADQAVQQVARQLGATVLSKPFDMGQLVALLADVLPALAVTERRGDLSGG